MLLIKKDQYSPFSLIINIPNNKQVLYTNFERGLMYFSISKSLLQIDIKI